MLERGGWESWKALRDLQGHPFICQLRKEVQSGWVTCPRSHSNWQTQNCNPDLCHSKSKQGSEGAGGRGTHVKNNSGDPDSSKLFRTSLVVQWLRIHLPMQGTRVWALIREDPTCRGATKPVHHNFWSSLPRARAPQQEKPLQWEARAPQQRVAPAHRN